MAKDPKRQLLGKIARQKGQYFEQRLDVFRERHRSSVSGCVLDWLGLYALW